jgi:pimeloyl-ACP methyl ester carboxylesterase
MPKSTINGVKLHHVQEGEGDLPLVLVHGSWTSHLGWDPLVPHVAGSFRVVRYDRRGHTQSERPPGQDSVHEDVADLAGLIEHLGVAPAWVVGNSFGASITLRLVTQHPDLVRGAVAHEPPLFGLLADDPAAAPLLEATGQRIGAVAERIAAGDAAGAAEQFTDTVALGPGAWAQLPPEQQREFIDNAPTFLHETRDPDQLQFDLEGLRACTKPVLLTRGDQSPPTFGAVIDLLAQATPRARVQRIAGAGHIPHITHPETYADAIRAFIDEHR